MHTHKFEACHRITILYREGEAVSDRQGRMGMNMRISGLYSPLRQYALMMGVEFESTAKVGVFSRRVRSET